MSAIVGWLILVGFAANVAAGCLLYEGYKAYKTGNYGKCAASLLFSIALATLFDFKVN